MSSASPYIAIRAARHIERVSRKSWLGTYSVPYAQVVDGGVFFVQIGAILGAEYAHQRAEFGRVFLGDTSGYKPLDEQITDLMPTLREIVGDRLTFVEYVDYEEKARLFIPQSDDVQYYRRANRKTDVREALGQFVSYAMVGTLLGLGDPGYAREIFDRGAAIEEPPEILLARASGGLPPNVHEYRSWAEFFQAENKMFLDYLGENDPEARRRLTES